MENKEKDLRVITETLTTLKLPVVATRRQQSHLKSLLLNHNQFKKNKLGFWQYFKYWLYGASFTAFSGIIIIIVVGYLMNNSLFTSSNSSPVTNFVGQGIIPQSYPGINHLNKLTTNLAIPNLTTPGKYAYEFILTANYLNNSLEGEGSVISKWHSLTNSDEYYSEQTLSDSYEYKSVSLNGKHYICNTNTCNFRSTVFNLSRGIQIDQTYWDSEKVYTYPDRGPFLNCSIGDLVCENSPPNQLPSDSEVTSLLRNSLNQPVQEWLNSVNANKYMKYIGSATIFNHKVYLIQYYKEEQLNGAYIAVRRIVDYLSLDNNLRQDRPTKIIGEEVFGYHKRQEEEILATIQINAQTNESPNWKIDSTFSPN